jgi:tetratricopeptide (TPR) repeat protein
MVPSPRANSSVSWLEVIVKTAVVFGFGWLLVSNMLSINRGVEVPPELNVAEQALKAKNVAGARAQFDKALGKNHTSTTTYGGIFVVCGTYQQVDLLDSYARQAQQACKAVPKTDQAQMYGALAGAYLDCGEKFAPQALTAAQQGFDLDPTSMDSMNSLAYTIAETTTDPVRLKQAEALILRALTDLNSKTAVPDRPLLEILYNDTYAWVLYKQGLYGPLAAAADKYALAARLLINVVSELPDGITGTVAGGIYYHLGAVYNKTGEYAQARNMLDIALRYNPGNVAATKELAGLPASTVPASTAPASSAPVPAPPKPAQQSKAGNIVQPDAKPAFTPLRSRTANAPPK